MRRLAACLVATLVAGLPAHAQERTMIVLDASVSMWGQIDGTAKIALVQDAVADTLSTLPEEAALGLAVFGRRADEGCADADVSIPPEAGRGAAIRAAVATLRPGGEAPLAAALKAAAAALRDATTGANASHAVRDAGQHRDTSAGAAASDGAAARMIVVAGGGETCGADPCTAARALAAESGAPTVDVIGLGLRDPAARSDARCIAETTGGRYRAAADADALGAALAEVMPQPGLAGHDITLRAILGEGDPEATEALSWEVTGPDGAVDTPEGPAILDLTLAPGAYVARATRRDGSGTATASFTLPQDAGRTVTLHLPAPLPEANLSAPERADAGATITVEWTGPGAEGDTIAASAPQSRRSATRAPARAGSPARLRMPAAPGRYELRYVSAEGGAILARRPIEVAPVAAEIETDTLADAGASVMVVWLGPAYPGDVIAVAVPGEAGHVTQADTRDGSPLRLEMPARPGEYEVRYVMAQDRTVLAAVPVTVLPVAARLFAESRVNAGAALSVDWDGPAYRNDYIAISRPGEDGFESRTPTRAGAPLTVTAPAVPGAYELRYVMAQDDTVLATMPLEVVAVDATLEAVESAPAGSPVIVAWEGPDYERDFITVARPDDPGYDGFRYTREGAPLILDMPTAPGRYELRYVAASMGETVLARRPITLTQIAAEIEAPGHVAPGANIPVRWTGPDYRRDYVAIAEAGAEPDAALSFAYTAEDSPVLLVAPEIPGTYELRYHLGRDASVIATTRIEVTEKTGTAGPSGAAQP